MLAATTTPSGVHNQPPQPTRLINRSRELGMLRHLLCEQGARLVTLTGPGGIGKTRLAIATSELLLDEPNFPDGIWFVDLAELREADQVPVTIARSLGIPNATDQPVMWRIQAHLRSQRLLLVLDNFEHVIDAAPRIAQLLATCPGVVLLATSREPLRLRWEHQLNVPPLELPLAGAEVLDGEELPAALALFVERACAADANFVLSRDNAADVVEVVRRLDGLPLAIELVAARVRTLTPNQLLERLDDPSLAAWDALDMPARHRSLHTAMAWSYQLLSPREQAALRQLAMFDTGCTLEALTSPGLNELSALVDKSLVSREITVSGAPRYRLLQPIRTYAVGLLAGSDHEQPPPGGVDEEGAPACSSPLSDRETAVLRLVAQGMHSKQIGRELFIAERTVKAHVTSILNKLGADTRSQAIGVAVRAGLV